MRMSHNIMPGFLVYLLKDKKLTTTLIMQTNENYLVLASDNNLDGREYKLSFSILAFYRS